MGKILCLHHKIWAKNMNAWWLDKHGKPCDPLNELLKAIYVRIEIIKKKM